MLRDYPVLRESMPLCESVDAAMIRAEARALERGRRQRVVPVTYAGVTVYRVQDAEVAEPCS